MPIACGTSDKPGKVDLYSPITMHLPLELVREIALFALAQPRTHSQDGGNNDKPEWASIHSFSLCSKAYRNVALEAWFSKLYTQDYKDTFPVGHLLPDIFTKWTRYFDRFSLLAQKVTVLTRIRQRTPMCSITADSRESHTRLVYRRVYSAEEDKTGLVVD